MKLSEKSNWNYQKFDTTLAEIENYRAENEWVRKARSLIPSGSLSYLELGCSPGFCSATISQGMDWDISGIDFSESEAVFLRTLKLIDKNARYFQGDIFNYQLHQKFDLVASYGLIEHFSDGELEEILKIHDQYLKHGGYLMIELPNFTGFQFIWHYLFDNPNLLIHNLKSMDPSILASYYKDLGYQIIFCDYIGTLKVWGTSRFDKNPILRMASKAIGLAINTISDILTKLHCGPKGKMLSPAILMIAKKSS